MSRLEAWLVHLATLLVGGTGLVYMWFLFFAEPADEFAVVNHPWQPHALHLHVLAAPLLVFGCGFLWKSHIWGRVRSGFPARRRTGLVLFALLVPMAASGYLLQVAVAETWRGIWSGVHQLSSAVWLAGYLVHQLSARQAGTRS